MDEKNIDEISQILFKQDINNYTKINLQFDNNDLKEVHFALLQIFTYGMKKLFGNSEGVVTLKNITDQDFNTINQYFKIIGFLIHYSIFNEDDYDTMIKQHFSFTEYKKLDSYRFKLKSENIIYVIYFSIL